jgi:tetratricopeptide (TPR) repeat protein
LLSEINRVTERAERHFPDSFDVNRVKGYVALTQRDFQTAVAMFQAAAGQKPDDGRVALGLVQSLQGAGNPEEAERLAKAFIERNGDYSPMYDFLYLGYFRQDRRDEALEVLENKRNSDPAEIAYQMQLARHYYVTGDRENMMVVIERLLDNPEQYPTAYARVGNFFMRIGEFDQAMEVYEKGAIALPDQRDQFRNRMVEALTVQGKREEAFQLVEQILNDDSENVQARAMRGALKLQTGDKTELQGATSDFESVLARMPDNVVLRFNLAEAYLAQGNLDRAIIEYQETIKRRPDYLPPRYGLARAYMTGGDHARAVAVAEEILSINPDDVAAKLIRSSAWIALGEKDQARASLQEIVKQRPNANEPVYHLARLHLADRKYDQAEALFRKVHERNPSYRQTLLGLVETILAQGRKDEAFQLLQAKIDQEPDNLRWRRAMGTTAIRAGQVDRATRELNFVLSKNPDDAMAHKQLAGIYYRGGQLGDAERHFRRAMELRPEDHVPYLYLGIMLESQHRLEDAAENYEKVIEISPANEVALNNLAYILSETTADLDRALTLAQRARSQAPDNPSIADTLSWIYIKKNLNDNAIRILDELVSDNPSQVTWRYHLAMALYQKGDHVRARKELETALRNNPSAEERSKIRELLARISS